MKLYLDTSPLKNGHSGRGIGNYTRMLTTALHKYTDVELVANKTDAELVHWPFFDLYFNTLPGFESLPTVVTIHDVIPLVLSNLYPPGIRGSLKLWWQKFKLGRVNLVVTDSETSTLDAIRHLRLPHAKVKTIYLAADDRYTPASMKEIAKVRERFNLHQGYFLYVGDINPNKGLKYLIEGFSKLNPNIELVLVSNNLRPNNQAARYVFDLIDKYRLETSIKILNNIGSDEIETMRGLYSGATAYVQPSLYEGFGLPVLEAQKCECPVISTHGGSLAEIVDKSGFIIAEANAETITNSLQTALNWTKSEREALINLGWENSQRFSWEKTALSMKGVYEMVVA